MLFDLQRGFRLIDLIITILVVGVAIVLILPALNTESGTPLQEDNLHQ